MHCPNCNYEILVESHALQHVRLLLLHYGPMAESTLMKHLRVEKAKLKSLIEEIDDEIIIDTTSLPSKTYYLLLEHHARWTRWLDKINT